MSKKHHSIYSDLRMYLFSKKILCNNLLLLFSISVTAQTTFTGKEHLFTTPPSYVIYKTNGTVHVDGIAAETSWKRASWSTDFVDIEGALKPLPPWRTRFKMMWDDNYLYVYAEMEEPHIWASKAKHDDIVFHDNDFELFIDPDGDAHAYYEIEVNAINTIFDLYLPKPYRDFGKPIITWTAEGLKTAVNTEGTCNNASDKDKKWSVEMAIPFSCLKVEQQTPYPVNNTVWRINFSRVQWDVTINNNTYERSKDVNGKLLPEHNYVWAAQGLINMHYPERWGYALFSDKQAGSKEKNYTLPFSEEMKKYCWLIYYKQKEYKSQHKYFANNIAALGFDTNTVLINQEICELTLQVNENGYGAHIYNTIRKEGWQINQEGKIIPYTL